MTGFGIGSTIKVRASRLLSLLFLALMGCRQGDFVPDAKFVGLYVELKLATVGFANDQDRANEVRRVILAQHHETPAGFHSKYISLMNQPKAWRKFQESVIEQVESFQNSHKKILKDTATASGQARGGTVGQVLKTKKGK